MPQRPVGLDMKLSQVIKLLSLMVMAMTQRPVGLDMKLSQPNMGLIYPLVKSYV